MEKIYSNFITPPDFVADDKETITIVNATTDDVFLLGRCCKSIDKTFNFYLYNSTMVNIEWLNRAVELSSRVILNDIDPDLRFLCALEKTRYYGPNLYVSPAVKVNHILDYFRKYTNISK